MAEKNESFNKIIKHLSSIYSEFNRSDSFEELATFISLITTNRLKSTQYLFLRVNENKTSFYIQDQREIPASVIEQVNFLEINVKTIRVFRKAKGILPIENAAKDKTLGRFLKESGIMDLPLNIVLPFNRGRKSPEGLLLLTVGTPFDQLPKEILDLFSLYKAMFSEALYRVRVEKNLLTENHKLEARLDDLKVLVNVDETLEVFSNVRTKVIGSLEDLTTMLGFESMFVSQRDVDSNALVTRFLKAKNNPKLEKEINNGENTSYTFDEGDDPFKKVGNLGKSLIINEPNEEMEKLKYIIHFNKTLNPQDENKTIQNFACFPIRDVKSKEIVAYLGLINKNRSYNDEDVLKIQLSTVSIAESFAELKTAEETQEKKEDQESEDHRKTNHKDRERRLLIFRYCGL